MMLALWSLLLAAQAAPAQPVAAPVAARVEIVLFSDFQCPFCAQIAEPIRELQAKGADGLSVTIQFKHFPLVIHPRAPLAHRAALAAAEQGRFWEMHDLLFANQARAQRDDLIEYARRLGLDLDRFAKDLDTDRIARIIAADQAEGERLRVSGTPTFYVNGKEYSGARTFDQLKQIVAGEQRRMRALADITDAMLSKGPAGAPVTLELFADLQSPVSGPAVSVLNQLVKRYPAAVRLQFRNFPLAFHPQAALAHEAAMTAAKAGQFWEFAAYALSHQDSLREQELIALAGRLGLDETSFADTIRQHTYAPRVGADVQAGIARGIRGSPTILVNGKRIDGVPSLDVLTEHVEAALSAARAGRPEKRQP